MQNSNSKAGTDVQQRPKGRYHIRQAAITPNPLLGTVRFKFRAFNHVAKKMYEETKLGDVFKWQNEGQVQSIMQFTGVSDCNGKEIFEGDIIKWGHKKNSSECWHRYAVVQINPDLQLKIIYYKDAKTQEQKTTDNHIFHWGRFAYGGSDLEIIGNVHENPELLG